MMGTRSAPAQLFHDFEFEGHVPGDYLLRQIDRFLVMVAMRVSSGPTSPPPTTT